MNTQATVKSGSSAWYAFALIGLVGGVLSGMFGIGGGVIMVPALLFFTYLDQKQAVGTSLAAIIPAAAVGALTYALQGDVDWLAALVLAAAMIVGTQVGSYLLNRLPQAAIAYGFVVLQTFVIISLWMTVPDRNAEPDWTLPQLVALFVIGLFTGVLAGLLGVGGGLIVVPVLIAFFGESDLVARGTSLMMMLPGAISGTIANTRRGFVKGREAAITGVTAAAAAPIGALGAKLIDPVLGNILLGALIAAAALKMLFGQLKKSRAARAAN